MAVTLCTKLHEDMVAKDGVQELKTHRPLKQKNPEGVLRSSVYKHLPPSCLLFSFLFSTPAKHGKSFKHLKISVISFQVSYLQIHAHQWTYFFPQFVINTTYLFPFCTN